MKLKPEKMVSKESGHVGVDTWVPRPQTHVTCAGFIVLNFDVGLLSTLKVRISVTD
jgi:hypothetical protein